MDQLRPATVVLAAIMPSFARDFAAFCAAQGMQVLGQCADGQSALENGPDRCSRFPSSDLHIRDWMELKFVRQLRPEVAPQSHHPLHQPRENTVP